jgi:hypothetical protein
MVCRSWRGYVVTRSDAVEGPVLVVSLARAPCDTIESA